MRQRISIIIGMAALGCVAATAAAAGTFQTTATVSGTAGISLSLPASASLTDTLDGSDQTVSYSPALGVVDARGTGAGWNLQISATDFSDGSGHSLAPARSPPPRRPATPAAPAPRRPTPGSACP